jgi:adenylate kinase
MILTILGAPGAGKGTMAKEISRKLNIPTISTGALLRDEVKSGSAAGKQIDELISKGFFVPDGVMIPLLQKRISRKDCENGCILDGFPRNVPQAERLSEIGIKLDKALLINVSDEGILTRLSGRLECSVCRATYHITHNPPRSAKRKAQSADEFTQSVHETPGGEKHPWVCGECGGELRERADDKPEIIAQRLEIYHRETEPLISYFRNKGLLCEALGETELRDTRANVFTVLGIQQ